MAHAHPQSQRKARPSRREWIQSRTLGRANDLFHRVARACAWAVGAPATFLLALALVASWAVLGSIFGYSDTWQLVINTSTTIVTFLIVFLIQKTQNRDAKAMQLKLDELLRALPKARTGLVDLEDLSEEELNLLQRQFETMRRKTQG